MKMEALIPKLNWFYNLELNQVDLYTAQSKAFQGSYAGYVFERVAHIEQGHVDNISDMIYSLGYNPTKLGDVIAPLIGKIAGTMVSKGGLENVLKANILLENKASRIITIF